MKPIHQMEPWLGEEEKQEILRVLESGWITEAGETKKFEEMLSAFIGTKYTSVVANGTVSLFAGLKALGVKQGDEVIVPDYTMVASPNSVLLAGATPVFVDIDKDTLCLNLDAVEKKLTKKTKVVMPVPINGRSPDMDRLMALSKEHSFSVLEDAAQALGSYYKGVHLGTIGQIGSFSFSTPKVITTGQGGALVTNDKNLYDNIIRLKDFGRIDRNTQDHDEVGYNFKFSDILAALGIAQMKKLPWRLERKKQMFKRYQEKLQGIAQLQFIPTDLESVSPWFIDIIVDNPVLLQGYLKTKKIGTRLFYPAIHMTKPYKGAETFPHSRWASEHGLFLPSSSFLTDEDIDRVSQEIRSFYEEN